MHILFFDTSAFLKLYRTEIGSSWIRTFVVGKQVVFSQLILLESASTLARLYRDGAYTKREASSLFAQINRDSNKYTVIPLGSRTQKNRLTALVFNLPPGLRLRTLDAIHLTEAKIYQQATSNQTPPVSFTFVSSDTQLLKVAQSQGMITENPEDHP